jgi:hypothetical protein
MNEKYVLFLDILGFKDLIENNSHEEIEKIYKHQVIESYGPAIHMSSLFSGQNIQVEFRIDGNILKDTVQNTLNLHIMSDSILIWTNDASLDSLMKLFAFASVYINLTFTMGVPLRGAISKGYISEIITPMNNNIQSCFVGTGIVKAYQLEGKQDWMGCIIDDECIKDIPKDVLVHIQAEKNSYITKYMVPFKVNGVIEPKEAYVVNWAISPSSTIDNSIEFFNSKFNQFKKDINNIRVKNKINNTYKFYTEMITKII